MEKQMAHVRSRHAASSRYVGLSSRLTPGASLFPAAIHFGWEITAGITYVSFSMEK
jgi:hypothetical protein